MKLSQSTYSKVREFISLTLLLSIFFIGSVVASTQKLTSSQSNIQKISSMGSSSQQVVVGRVKSVSARWVGKVIVTTAEIESVETIKGKPLKSLFKLSYVGGRVGVIEQQLSYPMQLEEGETAVFFMQDAPAKSALAGNKMLSSFDGKIPLLEKGEELIRLKDNTKISKFLSEIRGLVK